MSYQPPFSVTVNIVNLIAKISEHIGRLSVLSEQNSHLHLRRINRIRTIQGSLAIEGNTLSESQITAILEGKPVIAPPREILEVQNALAAYDQFDQFQPKNKSQLLTAHRLLMQGLLEDAGHYRTKGVGIMNGSEVIHMAPPASRVVNLIGDLFSWLSSAREHPLIVSAVFHYEFEFIHPFSDGNGRMGRLWQSLILSEWDPVFKYIPVESMVYAHQAEYYEALKKSTQQTDSAPFIEFMLSIILDVCLASELLESDQVSVQVSDQVKHLLNLLNSHSALTSSDIMHKLNLKHKPTFRKNYLQTALQNKWIEMTQPDSPKSPTQKYRITSLGRQLAHQQAGQ